jgi:hypothetical protein
MKIQPRNDLTDEQKYTILFDKWKKRGLLQLKEGGDIQRITIFECLHLKLFPLERGSNYYGPSLKTQVYSLENIYKYWQKCGRKEMTIYVTWDEYFYKKFQIPSRNMK